MKPFESEVRIAVNRSLRQIAASSDPIAATSGLENRLVLQSFRDVKTKRMPPLYRHRPRVFTKVEERVQEEITIVMPPGSFETPVFSVLIEQRMREQDLRYLDFARRGFIPPPWKKYGRRRGEQIELLRGA